MPKISKRLLAHPVARACSVTEADSKIEAARKAVAVMRQAGFAASAIAKAERMIEQAIARGLT